MSGLSSKKRSHYIDKVFQSNALAITTLLGKKTDEIYYIYSPNFLFFPLYFAAKLRAYPLILEKTELDSLRPDSGLKDLLVKFMFWLDEQFLSFMADKMVVISSLLKSHYFKRVKHIEVIPAFANTNKAKWEAAEGLNRIGYLGSFGSKDNVEGIIQAFLLAKKSRSELQLKLMGEFPAELQKKYAEQVEFSGRVPQAEFFENLYECDLLISNRSDTDYSRYGSPTKLVEYLATGIPVIATPIGSISQELQDGVHLRFVSPDDPELLAATMLDRYSDPEAYKAMGLRGQALCRQEMDASKILRKWVDFVLANP